LSAHDMNPLLGVMDRNRVRRERPRPPPGPTDEGGHLGGPSPSCTAITWTWSACTAGSSWSRASYALPVRARAVQQRPGQDGPCLSAPPSSPSPRASSACSRSCAASPSPGHSLADVATTGGSGAFLVGINQFWGFLAAGIAAAALMEAIGVQRRRGRDVATGVVLGAALGAAGPSSSTWGHWQTRDDGRVVYGAVRLHFRDKP